MSEQAPPSIDELNVQLPGRVMALEILVTLLLAEKANAVKLCRVADEMLTRYESAEFSDPARERSQYAVAVYTAARISLDTITTNVRMARGV